MEILFKVFLIINIITCSNAKSNSSVFNYDVMFFQNDYHVIPERMELVRYNKKLIDQVEFKTFKFNRTCAAANITMRFHIDRSEKLEMIIQAYKFLSNEYRHFPMRFEVNCCKAFEVNLVGMRNALKCGNYVGCPLQKGKTYRICNWTPDERKFPPSIPTGKYKVRTTVMYESEEVMVIDNYANIVNSLYIFKK